MTEKLRTWREDYHFANCVIRCDTRELLRDGIAQKIERRSFDLILYLLQLEGRVASKDELLFTHIDGLTRFAADTHARVLQALGPASRFTASVEDLVCRADPLLRCSWTRTRKVGRCRSS